MAMRSNNNQLAFHHNHHQISSFNPSRASCSPIFGYFRRRIAATCDGRPELHRSGLMSTSSSTSEMLKTRIRHHDQDLADEEPVSPKVGCMGHIKKNGNSSNRKVGQFRRMFSLSVKGTKVEDDNSRISIADTMDLPLPVLKHKFSSPNTEINNLWKRRHESGRHDLHRLDVLQLKLQAEARLQNGFTGLELRGRFNLE